MHVWTRGTRHRNGQSRVAKPHVTIMPCLSAMNAHAKTRSTIHGNGSSPFGCGCLCWLCNPLSQTTDDAQGDYAYLAHIVSDQRYVGRGVGRSSVSPRSTSNPVLCEYHAPADMRRLLRSVIFLTSFRTIFGRPFHNPLEQE